jgi:uncharacterized protein YchJ
MLGLTGLLLFGLAGTASAASKPQEIKVLLNGKALTFQVAPASIKGSTFVEFRSLFTQLGYTINYDAKTKTIQAKSDEHEIKMTVGGDVAFVDGKTVPINGQLQSLSGRTVVGVRFIATLSGKDVSWDAAASTVQIVDKGPTDQEKAAVLGLFNKLKLAEAASDSKGIIQLVAEDAPIREALEQTLPARMERVKTSTTVLDKKIVSFSKDEAVVVTKERTERVSGDYYFNNTSENQYTLHPDASGQWLIYNIETLGVEYDNPDALLNQAVAVPDEDKAAIDALLKAQNDAYNAEDTDAFKATVVPFEGLDETLESLKNVFSQVDITYTIEKSAIVSFGDDRAVVVQSKIAEAKEQDVKIRLIQGNELVKQDGKWLFDQTEYVLKQEQL